MNIKGFLWKNNGEGVLLMKKIFYVTSVVVIACVIASSVIASVTTPAEPSGSMSPSQVSVMGGGYVLTCDGDRIVAYVKGSDRPYIETTTAVSSLPYDVQRRLKEGIEFDTPEELQEAINEYCS